MNDFTRRNWRCRLLQFNPPSRPPAQLERHSIRFVRRGEKSNAGRKERGGEKAGRFCKYKKRYPILMGKERTLAFLKFMLADVPSAYACIRILCTWLQRRIGRSMPKKNSRGTIALKKRNANALSWHAIPISSLRKQTSANGFFHSLKYRTISSHSITLDGHWISIFVK